MLTSNRGLAGGYNGNVLAARRPQLPGLRRPRASGHRWRSPASAGSTTCGIRSVPIDATYTHFEDRPQFDEVEELADKYIAMYVKGEIDRLDVVYTQFINSARQEAIVQTLLPMTADSAQAGPSVRQAKAAASDGSGSRRGERVPYEFLPDAAEHPRGDRPCLVQGPALQVLPRRGRQRADRPDGRHAGSDRERRRHDQDADPAVQPRPQAQITRELAEIIGGGRGIGITSGASQMTQPH